MTYLKLTDHAADERNGQRRSHRLGRLGEDVVRQLGEGVERGELGHHERNLGQQQHRYACQQKKTSKHGTYVHKQQNHEHNTESAQGAGRASTAAKPRKRNTNNLLARGSRIPKWGSVIIDPLKRYLRYYRRVVEETVLGKRHVLVTHTGPLSVRNGVDHALPTDTSRCPRRLPAMRSPVLPVDTISDMAPARVLGKLGTVTVLMRRVSNGVTAVAAKQADTALREQERQRRGGGLARAATIQQ